MLDFPDYRGADERTTYVLPLPYFVYRGDVFRVDHEGVRGLFLNSDRIELDVSANASVPVKSSDNQARHGMPDLDPIVELGPTLDVTLLRSLAQRTKLKLELPLRAAIATDLTHAHSAGWVFQPQLSLDVNRLELLRGWRLGAAAGPVFADQRYHSYYYGVEPQFATAQRPAYQARGGYSGAQMTLATSRRFSRFWVGAFARYDWLSGAVFEDSPLVRQNHAFAAGFALAWVFARSSVLVDADE